MFSLEKLCADHLRNFSKKFDVKLKPSHAHEIVAAFFGYKSNMAMKSDDRFPIECLPQAEIIVFQPGVFIDQRRQCLKDLSSDLPATPVLAEELRSFVTKELPSARVFSSTAHLSEIFVREYLQEQGHLITPNSGTIHFYENLEEIFNNPLYEFNPQIELTENQIKLVVTNCYRGSQEVNRVSFGQMEITFSITLERLAGQVGYSRGYIVATGNSILVPSTVRTGVRL